MSFSAQTGADEITLVAGPWSAGTYYPAATMVLRQLELPNWTTATRPSTGLNAGRIGYNTTLGVLEEWTGSAWQQMASAGTSAIASLATPLMDGAATAGVSGAWAAGDHVHPTDTSRYAASNPSSFQTAAQVATSLALYAPLASAALTGTPTAPTAAANTNTTQLATTAFVLAQASSALPLIDGTAAPGSLATYARADHVHPTDTTRAAVASPTFTGVPAGPTAAPSTNTTQLASTAFVTAAVVAATTGVSTFNTRSGAVTLTSLDVTTALTFSPYNATNPNGYQTAANVTTTLASPPAIGGTAAAAGSFTTLSATSTVSGAGMTARFATPGPIGNTSASTGAFTTVTATTVTASTAGSAIKGLTAGSNPAAGNIGEVITASNNSTTISSGVTGQLVTVSLTAGNWLVVGYVNASPASAHTLNNGIVALSTSTASLTGQQAGIQVVGSANGSFAVNPLALVNVSGTTSYYLNANLTDSGANPVTINASSITAIRLS